MLPFHANPFLCTDADDALSLRTVCKYWVTRQDVAQETEEWAESAALASAAHSAHFSVSCATSCRVTQYTTISMLHTCTVIIYGATCSSN